MKNGPSTPRIKQYLKACENSGYRPTAIKMCYTGDVIMFFGTEIRPEEAAKNEWDIRLENP